MEAKARFPLLRQSSLAPETRNDAPAIGGGDDDSDDEDGVIDPGVRLMYLANEGDLDGIKELLNSGTDVNFQDIDDRTPLHVAACQGRIDVMDLLLQRGAHVEPKDRWGSTPLADAIHYENQDVIKLLEKHGAKLPVDPMHVKTSHEVPEYEIDPKEIDFSNSVELKKGTFRIASWRGTQVAVKTLREEVITNDNKVKAFIDELAVLPKIRHPNVVQFLGAVTESSPMMIITEYLPKGDLCAYMKGRGPLKPRNALRFAMDIARGLNYLHENKPEAIIHRDLEPANILRDDTGHLKVADFRVSKLLNVTNRVKEDRPLTCQGTSCRYVAPEVFRNQEYDTKVDVFSFAVILQEMIEGCPPFFKKLESEVPKAFAAKDRPPFRAPAKYYAHGLRELIEECWNDLPAKRPTFKQLIPRLESIYVTFRQKKRWKVKPLKFFHNLEAIWKKDYSSSGSHSRSSHINSI